MNGMNRSRHRTIGIVVLVLLSPGLYLVPPGPAVAQNQEPCTRLCSTPDNPIPTAPVRTTQVVGTVGLDPRANGVSIDFSNQEAVPIRPVGLTTVAGTLRVVRASDSNVVQATGSFSVASGGGSGRTLLYIVPAGKRLVIEHASGSLSAPPMPRSEFWTAIDTTVGGVSVRHVVPIRWSSDPLRGPLLSVLHLFSQPMRVYADPGTSVVGSAGLSGEVSSEYEGWGGNFSISGYLVDL
jgi:hypothetical protein